MQYVPMVFLVALTAGGVGGCTWVKLNDAGAAVQQATAADIQGCDRVGVANSKTTRRVVFKRSKGKVQEELITLARNQAAALGGNAVVPSEDSSRVDSAGEQEFIVYRCP